MPLLLAEKKTFIWNFHVLRGIEPHSDPTVHPSLQWISLLTVFLRRKDGIRILSVGIKLSHDEKYQQENIF